MTREMVNQQGEGMVFANTNEALSAYDAKLVSLHAKIKLRVQDYEKTESGFDPSTYSYS